MKTRCEDDPTYAHRHSFEYAWAMVFLFVGFCFFVIGFGYAVVAIYDYVSVRTW